MSDDTNQSTVGETAANHGEFHLSSYDLPIPYYPDHEKENRTHSNDHAAIYQLQPVQGLLRPEPTILSGV